jgi:hypothetical protein
MSGHSIASPKGMIRPLARRSAVALASRGSHHSGTEIRRPSFSVTDSSVEVHATAFICKPSPSSSCVFLPLGTGRTAFQQAPAPVRTARLLLETNRYLMHECKG